MLVNDKLVFLQMQKTGCTHVESILFKIFPNSQQIGKHFRIPSRFEFRSRPVVGSIRDPWDWYLSYWAYSCLAKGGPYKRTVQSRNPLNVILDSRQANSHNEVPRRFTGLLKHSVSELFRPVGKWQYLYEDVNDPERFRLWLELVLSEERKFDLFQDYGLSSISQFSGLYTYLTLFLYAQDISVLFSDSFTREELQKVPLVISDVLKTEQLNEDFINFLKKIDIPITSDIEQALNAKTNTSKRKLPRDAYYNGASIDLVAKQDTYILKKFGYKYI